MDPLLKANKRKLTNLEWITGEEMLRLLKEKGLLDKGKVSGYKVDTNLFTNIVHNKSIIKAP